MRRAARRLAASLLTLALLLAGAAHAVQAEGEDAPSGDGVLQLLGGLAQPGLAAASALMEQLHDYFISVQAVRAAMQAAELAQAAREQGERELLTGSVTPEALDALAEAAQAADTALQLAQMTQLKSVNAIKAGTGLDARQLALEPEALLMLVPPDQIQLGELAPDGGQAPLELSQLYIDLNLAFASVKDVAALYAKAAQAEKDALDGLRMGAVSQRQVEEATLERVQASAALYTELAGYSRLVYQLNALSGGAVCQRYERYPQYLGGPAREEEQNG